MQPRKYTEGTDGHGWTRIHTDKVSIKKHPCVSVAPIFILRGDPRRVMIVKTIALIELERYLCLTLHDGCHSVLKKISVERLVVGMYVKELCGSWAEHPFWRTRFLLDNPDDIGLIQRSSINEVWIDTSRGIDLSPDVVAVSETDNEAEVDKTLGRAAAGERNLTQVPVRQEIMRAKRILRNSQGVVNSLFEEARLGKAVDMFTASRLVDEISDSLARNHTALLGLARLKDADAYTYMHSVAVSVLMVALARQLQMSEEEVRLAGLAGLMHDVGKSKIPLAILNKPDRLTESEFSVIKKHPEEGHRILVSGGHSVDPVVLDVCLHHHEKVDGSGYPEGLERSTISQFAKMAAVCDVYDAITSNRPYKSGWDPAKSIRKMAEWTKDHFEEQIFHGFVKSLGIYPTGSLVRLQSGYLGVVVEQSQDSLLKPVVKVFYSTKNNCRMPIKIIKLNSPGVSDQIVGREEPSDWNFPDLDELWAAES